MQILLFDYLIILFSRYFLICDLIKYNCYKKFKSQIIFVINSLKKDEDRKDDRIMDIVSVYSNGLFFFSWDIILSNNYSFIFIFFFSNDIFKDLEKVKMDEKEFSKFLIENGMISILSKIIMNNLNEGSSEFVCFAC